MCFLLTVSGCSPKTAEATLSVDLPDEFAESGSRELPGSWWTEFGDQTLNILVDSVLQNNFDLKSYYYRLKAARAVVDRESASLLPFVDASAHGGISRTQTDFEESQRFQFGLGADYEVDLWGRIGSRVDAERFRAEATRLDYHAAMITISAEICRSYFQLREARNQLRLSKEQIQTNEQILRLLRNRFGTGDIRSVDILRQRQLLEATREEKSYVEARVATIEHQLAVLLGHTPRYIVDTLVTDLPELPLLPETGIPAELIERRPDVRSAYNILKAADRDLASAISSRYPRLTLSVSASSSAENINALFRDWGVALAGNLLAPVFYGGQLKAEVARNEAVQAELLNAYAKVVLIAFQEVENALVLERKQREAIASLEEQLELARQSYEQLRIEYFNGLNRYIDVLTALDQQQQLQRDLLNARLGLLEYRIGLYRALAGEVE